MTSATTHYGIVKLLYVHGGSLLVRYANRLLLVPDTFGLLIPADTQHTEQLTPGAVVQDVLLRLTALPQHSSCALVVNSSPLLLALVKYATCLPVMSEKRQHAEAVIVDLLAPASSAYELVLPTDSRLLQAAENVLREPVGPHLTTRCAALAGLSTGKFTRMFEAETETFWADWCFAVKMHHAMSLLNQGISVGDVSHLVNYKTPSSFNIAFKRYFGVNPGASKPHTVCEWCGHIKSRRAQL